MAKQLAPVLKTRRNLCLEIVEKLALDWGVLSHRHDFDHAAEIVDAMLPMTMDESIAEWNEMDDEAATPTPPKTVNHG